MERNQFTFYKSFFDSIKKIKKASDRAKAYDAICEFALYEKMPDVDSLPDTVSIVFTMVLPNLEASRKKAEAGKQGGSKPKANAKQIESKTEANRKQVKEQEKEQDKDKEQMLIKRCDPKQEEFERFWAVYPKKVGKEAARKAFSKVKVPVDTLIAAVEAQKRSTQWTRDNGQYIPNPATWLNQGRWEDVLETAPAESSDVFQMDEAASQAIQAMKRWREKQLHDPKK